MRVGFSSLRLFVFLNLILGCGGGNASAANPATAARGSSRVTDAQITYTGSFEVPAHDSTSNVAGDLTYGGHALGFNSVRGSLLFGAHDWYQNLVEIEIPTDYAQTARVLQDAADVSDGQLGAIDGGSVKLGGTLVHNGKLIVTAYSDYDADSTQTLSHFRSGLDLSAADDATAPAEVSGTANSRSKAGYMTAIPAEWQGPLGGKALTGNCCLNIMASSSAGPSATVFDPDAVGTTAPVPGQTVLFYPIGNPLTQSGTHPNPIFVQSDSVVGVAFPPGTSSVLFVGRHGKGPYCYGPGTTDTSLHGTPDGEGNTWCYDPVSASKGTHAFPYVHQIWAYDANDLVAVKNGKREPWLQPYATYELNAVNASGGATIAGATFDPATGRLFLTEQYGQSPRVHVFHIAKPSSGGGKHPR